MASDQPQGSENYSVDEMMARLKRNERHKTGNTPQPDADQDGELITRDDGSQVVKVRRRKCSNPFRKVCNRQVIQQSWGQPVLIDMSEIRNWKKPRFSLLPTPDLTFAEKPLAVLACETKKISLVRQEPSAQCAAGLAVGR
ncbi:MAG: hypothetical protein ACPG6P_06660 [Akkermansiaceae bacterium]